MSCCFCFYLPNQCKPSPCHIPGTKQCNDLQGNFKCLCHNGWKGKTCAEDVNECEKQNGGCEHYCRNDVAGYMCVCEKDGLQLLLKGVHDCVCSDIDECEMPDACGSADCINSPGSHSCNCNKGFVYNETLKACYDVDECTKKPCEQACVNNVGSYMCRCDGRRGYLLHPNLHNSAGSIMPVPVICLYREILAFSIRTYDPEGLLLYTQRREPEKRSLAVALRDGHLEVQLQDGDDRVVTTGGPIINTGTWHSVVVERLRRQLIVRVAGEEVININRPDDAHKGTSRVEIALGGLTISTPSLIRPLPLRLDGCMRQLSLLEQDTSWLSQHISENPSQQCFSAIELGSYFSGSAYIHPRRQNYSDFNPAWNLQLAMDFRTMQPKPHSGLLFALVHGNEVPLSLSLQPTDRIAMQVCVCMYLRALSFYFFYSIHYHGSWKGTKGERGHIGGEQTAHKLNETQQEVNIGSYFASTSLVKDNHSHVV
uniref:Uncharacterized protein n=1 Tax=Eptatretus burgeri TaxID=7764 RepID=A0A8C4QJB4_EPTBU